MLRITLTFLSSLLFCLISLLFPFQSYAKVMINEFYSSGGSDWVELFSDSSDAVDLSLYVLVDESGNTKDLTGNIAQGGFATFDWSNRLNDSGDTIKLQLKSDQSITDEIIYGNGSLSAPESTQSGGRSPDGSSTWVVFAAATKGSTNGSSIVTPTNTPTPTPSNTPTPTKTPTPTSTPKPTSTPTLTPTPKSTTTNTPAPTRKEATYPTTKANTGKLSTTIISPVPTAVLGSSTEETTPQPTKAPSPTQEVKTLSTANTPLQTAFLIGMGVLAVTTVALGGYIYKQSKDHL